MRSCKIIETILFTKAKNEKTNMENLEIILIPIRLNDTQYVTYESSTYDCVNIYEMKLIA